MANEANNEVSIYPSEVKALKDTEFTKNFIANLTLQIDHFKFEMLNAKFAICNEFCAWVNLYFRWLKCYIMRRIFSGEAVKMFEKKFRKYWDE